MNIRIERMRPDLEGVWFEFFSGPAFEDNPPWSGCYCTYFFEEGAESRGGLTKRRFASKLIREGAMDGYLALDDGGKVVGWCNANRKTAFPAFRAEEGAAATKMVVCFIVHPGWRRRGVARAILERVVAEAREEGYAWVEARPSLRARSLSGNYHGHEALYRSSGFTVGKAGRSGLAKLALSPDG